MKRKNLLKPKKILCVMIFSLGTFALFAATEKPKDIDVVIDEINEELVTKLKRNSIVCVMDFATPSKDLSEYLREGITSELTENLISNRPVMLAMKLRFQFVSGLERSIFWLVN